MISGSKSVDRTRYYYDEGRSLKVSTCLKSRIYCCIVNSALIVVEHIFSKTHCEYLLKLRFIAFLQLVVFEKVYRTKLAINRLL